MKICIPIEFKAQGGGFYFLQAFENYLQGRGHAIVKIIDEQYDLLFTNHWMVSRRDILRAIGYNPQVRIIQRIDGAAQDYGRDPEADFRQMAVNKLADLTIFQSEYCRYSTRQKYRVIRQDGPVIHNPVDSELFQPNGEKRQFGMSAVLAVVNWSYNPMKGADSVYQVAKTNPNIGFALCGNFADPPDLPNLFPLGILNRKELAITLRGCIGLLTFSQNEACPNHVLEALASGLPVLFLDSGATSEVVGDGGLPVTIDTFSGQYERIVQYHKQFSKAARYRAVELFNPLRQFSRYELELNNTLVRPLHVSPTRRRFAGCLDCLIPARFLG